MYRRGWFGYRKGTRSSRRWNRGTRRRVIGNSRSARQQRDAATVTISRFTTLSVPVLNGATGGTAFIQHWDSLRNSTYFSNYSGMYDQIKIDKIRVKLNGTNAGATTDAISPTVVIAFDRNGLDSSQLAADGTSLTTGVNGIATYSSAQTKQWSNGNSFVMYQTIYPSTIMEKGQYIPTDSLTTTVSSANPAYAITDSTMPFKPVTLVGVSTNGITTLANATYIFSAEIEYTVTFRGMRKPSLSSSSGDISLIPLNENIASNGTFSYVPTGDDDGFSEVSIVVNVPQSVTVGYLAYSFVFAGTSAPTGTYVISSLTGGTTQSISGDDRNFGSYVYYDSSDRGIHWTATNTKNIVSITFTSTQYFILSYKYYPSTVRSTSVIIYDRNGVSVANLGNLTLGSTVYVPDNVVVDLN